MAANDELEALNDATASWTALKASDTFVVLDGAGDIPGIESAVHGLYRDDTRMLSRWLLTLGGHRPRLLSGAVSRDHVVHSADLSNPGLPVAAGAALPEGSIHLERAKVLYDGACYEQLTLTNFNEHEVILPLEIGFGADFRDIFEVRGAQRSRRGETFHATAGEQVLLLRYTGLDNIERHTSIGFSARPDRLGVGEARFRIALPARGSRVLVTCIGRDVTTPPDVRAFRSAAAAAHRRVRRSRRPLSVLRSNNALFDEWLQQAGADLALLTTDLATGPYPYAGVPWFSTAFGRDAIITALEVLWLKPELARGVLAFLGERQAVTTASFVDADPGKILHEVRKGEMATLGEVPFATYFGGVDTTPLFIMLAAAYLRRTGDLAFIEWLWPRVTAALAWIDRYGDRDDDGLVEYERAQDTGLANQGWKDSHDSVFHADGRMAAGPIALVEVQGYVFAARRGAAEIADALGLGQQARELRRRAAALRRVVEKRFWDERLGTYVLALDGRKRPCAVRTSNAGHLLYCGLPSAERARRLVDQFLSPAFFTGWGIRTVAAGEPRYNPMSYHNGSIWPHDNAILAAGFDRYGFRSHAERVFNGLFDAAMHLPQPRLPELFCGFPKRQGRGPTSYAVACAPQAWSSAAVFLLLKSCLGLKIDARRGTVRLERPQLPRFLERLDIQGLTVGAASVSLRLARHGADTDVTVTARDAGPLRVLISK